MKKNNYRHPIVLLAAVASVALLPVEHVKAINTQIQTDSTLSGIGAQTITGVNHVYTLSEINGQTVGSNLFYSFSTFNVGTSDTALFDLHSSNLENVISRVTGGAESLIDGQLQMTNVGSAPSFFFINPAGITFGAGASVDVPGSFYVSTASGLNMSDGNVYAANEPQASTLSAASPESFGFLGDESGSINVRGLETEIAKLTFKPGTEVAFVGNDIHIENALIKNFDNFLSGLKFLLLTTGNESLNIVWEVLSNQPTQGNLTIQNAMIDVSGNGSGYLGIRSGDIITKLSTLDVENVEGGSLLFDQAMDIYANSLLLDNTFLVSGVSGTGVGSGGDININVTDSLKLQGIGTIVSGTAGSGDSGDVSVTTENLEIAGLNLIDLHPTISSLAHEGTGNAGVVNIIANSIILIDGGQIQSQTSSQGKAGEIYVLADQIEIIGSGVPNVITGISSQARVNSANDAGKITVIAQEKLILQSGGQISASTFSQGKAGDIEIFSKNLDLKGLGFTNISTSIDSQAREGSTSNAGQISVTVTDKLTLMGGGQISSGTFSQGNAGTIKVSANQIEIDGQGLVTGISSQAEKGVGDAGQVFVNATNTLELKGGGQISSSSFSQGKAGNVVVVADQIIIDGLGLSNVGTGIASQATPKSTNDAGNVTVTASDTIQILNGGQIGSDTFAQGNAGNVNVSAQHIEIDGSGSINDTFTGISSQAQPGSSGNAGQVSVLVTGRLELMGGGQISSSVLPQTQGSAGEVIVTADQIVIDGRGGLSNNVTGIHSAAASDSRGNAGQVTVTAYDTLNLLAEAEISSSTFSDGEAGEVIVNVRQLNMDNSTISSGALGSNGKTGDINIIALDNIYLKNQSIITNVNLAITTDSNADPGGINIFLEDGSLYLDSSVINTASINGDGGAIDINAKNIIYLLNSPIITSVFGPLGNGGDINIAANSLIMDSGFIQANTVATGASGGDVNIKVPVLIPSSSFLQTGGNTPFEFQPFSGINVIQAAAPDGVSGTITAATPQLNLSGVLTNLVIESFDSNTLNHNMCAIEEGSSLHQSGKGGMRMRARDFLMLPAY